MLKGSFIRKKICRLNQTLPRSFHDPPLDVNRGVVDQPAAACRLNAACVSCGLEDPCTVPRMGYGIHLSPPEFVIYTSIYCIVGKMMINPRIWGVAYFGDKPMFFRAGIKFFGQEILQFMAFGCDL